MHPGATLFIDVCVQRDLGPDGAWPVLTAVDAANAARLFTMARELEIRQGGVLCLHDGRGIHAVGNAPEHCTTTASSLARPEGCSAAPAVRISRTFDAEADRPPSPSRDEATAIYVDSGCAADPDAHPHHARLFDHLTAGVRDAVVFGAGIEYGLWHVVGALLRRRIRTHVTLDAAGGADEKCAQTVVALWKRRGVDGLTVDTLERLLRRG